MNDCNRLYTQHIIARHLRAHDGFEGTADDLDKAAEAAPYSEYARDLYTAIKDADEYNLEYALNIPAAGPTPAVDMDGNTYRLGIPSRPEYTRQGASGCASQPVE